MIEDNLYVLLNGSNYCLQVFSQVGQLITGVIPSGCIGHGIPSD